MYTGIVLLRGINVGGSNKLLMKDLVSDLASLGLKDVVTYIQSGNAVFRSPRKFSDSLGEKIAACIEGNRGFRPQVIVLTDMKFREAIRENPFPEAEVEPKSLHVFFLASQPSRPDHESLAKIAAATERFALVDRAFYLHAPNGLARSKLAVNVERLLNVPATARNWRTVQAISELI